MIVVLSNLCSSCFVERLQTVGVGCAQPVTPLCSTILFQTWPGVGLLGSVALLISCPVESTHLEPVVLVGRRLEFICQEA